MVEFLTCDLPTFFDVEIIHALLTFSALVFIVGAAAREYQGASLHGILLVSSHIGKYESQSTNISQATPVGFSLGP